MSAPIPLSRARSVRASRTSPRQRCTVTFPELFRLPVTVDLATAAGAFGVSMNTAYRQLKHDRFPCRVLRGGWNYRVPTMALMKALGIESLPVRFEDVDSGAEFAVRIG